MYAILVGENQVAYNKDNLKRFAAELGLNTEEFNQCLDSGEYSSVVEQETQLSRQIGVTSTPTFLINGQAVLGAQPFDAFQGYIESAISE